MGRLMCVAVFLLLTTIPEALQAQSVTRDGQTSEQSGIRVRQNYPNPFNPTTRIPFELDASVFESGRPVEVTIRIFNVLHQLVAVPEALDHPAGSRVAVDRLAYATPGLKEAFWDGLDTSGRKVASGLYYYQVLLNGRPVGVWKMLVTK